MVAEISECFFVFAKRLYSSRRVKTVIFIRVAYIDFFNTHLVFDLDTHLFVPNPYNMGVYRLPWTPAVKIWKFELTQDQLDTEDTEGMQRSLCLFCSQPEIKSLNV